MNRYSQHIALFLFLLFLTPQANNALHYLWVEHHFDHRKSDVADVSKKHDGHNCDTSIFKLPAAINVQCLAIDLVPGIEPHTPVPAYTAPDYLHMNVLYRLRGPPRPGLLP